MKTRRDLLLGLVAGAAGFGMLSGRAGAWSVEEMSPSTAAAYAAACRRPSAAKQSGEDHNSLIASARQDLVQRIKQGLLPAGATEQVGCPVCGCSFVVSAN
jgi:hypothetical protein